MIRIRRQQTESTGWPGTGATDHSADALSDGVTDDWSDDGWAEPTDPAQVEDWTNGTRLRTRLTALAMVAGIIVASTVLTVMLTSGRGHVAAPHGTNAEADASRTARAGEIATGLVRAWLSPASGTALEPFIAGAVAVVPARPPRVAQVSVADVTRGAGQVLTVTVGADVDGVRRHFAVPLVVGDAGITALSLPVPVPAPRRGEPVGLAYPDLVSPSGPAAQTAAAFLAALLSGKGDVTRYTRPGVSIAPITPAPYSRTELASVKADAAEPKQIKDGAKLRLLVTTNLTDGAGRRYSTTYALLMAARGGRWEVAAMEAAPSRQPDPSTKPADSAGSTTPR